MRSGALSRRTSRDGSIVIPQDTKDYICELIAAGKSLRAVLRDYDGMPASSTVFKELAADAEFAEQYARARESQADTLFDEILEIADSSTQADDRRVRIDARKWMAGKLRPKKYGEKQEVELSGAVQIGRIERAIIKPEAK